MSTTLPNGAPNIQGQPIWMNLNSSAANVDVVGNAQIISDAQSIGISQARIDMYQAAQAAGEGEALLAGTIEPSAMTTTMPPSLQGGTALFLTRGSQALSVVGALGTTYRLSSSVDQSFSLGTPAPVGSQIVREAGGWAGAWMGFKGGAAFCGALGIESGPGALVTGLAGGIVGGFVGYWAGDEIVSP